MAVVVIQTRVLDERALSNGVEMESGGKTFVRCGAQFAVVAWVICDGAIKGINVYGEGGGGVLSRE